jgi:predicted ABC-type transport system involved in lysophospholipase L1 biosynthesis ATPase subunit
MNRTEGTTFVMVTHNTDLACLTKRRLIMQQGALREE